ncbi:MAG: Nif3-like dinuclear metal center hexameric protein [Candidatus Gracilibacteria bacterium]|nr:Nif3-like dinuclear metal center hexameric protein [Candidatus Gracilibacteria bacterium]
MKKSELISYLDSYLKIADFKDDSKNGLQVDTARTEIKKVGFAVDAASYIFDRAIAEKVDFLIVHHGLFWGFDTPITGVMYERMGKLIKNDIGFYGCHLPLDALKEVGNNWGLLDEFLEVSKLSDFQTEEFGEYKGNTIGAGVRFKERLSIKILQDFLESKGILYNFYDFGNIGDSFSSLAILSGGGGDEASEASKKGYDIYLTGEGPHYATIITKELKQSLILGGHYETETIGVRLLAKHLQSKFGLETVFLDEKY